MSPIRMSRLESAIRVVIDFNDAFNHHDMAGMIQLISEDCVIEDAVPAPEGTRYVGKGSIIKFWNKFFLASPQAHIKIEDIYGSGTRCVMRFRYAWVDASEGKRYVRGADLFTVKNGLITEKLSYIKG